MIALAWETGHTVLVALAWMVLALSIAAGMTATGLGWGAAWAWRRLSASLAAVRAARALGEVRSAGSPSDARTAPRLATGPGMKAPSRPHSPRHSAPQGDGGGFPAPDHSRPSTGRTETSTKETA